jgi:cobalt-precorrin 5A hydrolase
MGSVPARPIKVVAITPGGAALARRVCAALPGAQCWLPRSQAGAGPEVKTFRRLSQVFQEAFRTRENLVCIMAAGIVVRGIAPFLRGKDLDPAVVVLDEGGQFAVSLLSGHLGGANELARQVARILGGTPVITTASDIRGLPALDLLATQLGLTIENLAGVRGVQMALLSGRPIRVVDPDGYLSGPLAQYPGLFTREPDLEAALVARRPTVYVGFREGPWPEWWLVLRPKNLVAGVGCHQGTPAAEILDFIKATFKEERLSLLSLKALATIAAKQEEPGLVEAARSLGVELIWFTAEELEKIAVPHPSKQVARHLGVESVSEAAALKAGGVELIVPKRKAPNATLAVARVACR